MRDLARRYHHAVLGVFDLCAERLETLEMRVKPAMAYAVPSGRRQGHRTLPGEERSGKENACADLRRQRRIQARGLQLLRMDRH